MAHWRIGRLRRACLCGFAGSNVPPMPQYFRSPPMRPSPQYFAVRNFIIFLGLVNGALFSRSVGPGALSPPPFPPIMCWGLGPPMLPPFRPDRLDMTPRDPNSTTSLVLCFNLQFLPCRPTAHLRSDITSHLCNSGENGQVRNTHPVNYTGTK
ncbi:hypothetical protein EJ06DRAFT_16238 [Trichodelitschia bisporula]|uniref:Uncharacterized protein n=1 Tax=Trichodelitschia bisporula TaxID=703511 RepID=A0A6G1IA51_9PEZI|nr:hypothetical protein EJ06DRAFT_16238 [Trichodelitschia bisporula]